MTHANQVEPSIQTIRLRPGLDAKGLEVELVRANRTCDVSRRTLAFYLHDMQRRGLHQALGFNSTIHFAQVKLSMSRRQARDFITVGSALGELPAIDRAFCDGRLPWSKLRLLTTMATPETEKAWLERAQEISCQLLEAEIRGAEKGRPPRENSKGTPSVRFSFTAKLAPTAHELLQQARKMICADAEAEVSDADFLVALAEHRLRNKNSEKQGNTKVDDSMYRISIGQCPDCEQAHVNTEDGPIPLSESEAAAIRCDAQTIGHPLDAPTSPALRRRVLARDGNRCVHCHSGHDLHAHHIVFRAQGGRTSIENLVCLCANCHGRIHDGFLNVTGRAPHKLTFTDRDGREVSEAIVDAGIKVQVDYDRLKGTHAPLGHSCAKGENLSELVGQQQVIATLEVACKAAKKEKRPVRHILLSSPPGLGKTTMARAVAVESKVPFVEKVGPSIQSLDEMAVPDGGVLFIDEIHGLARPVAELLYGRMDCQKITVIGATTNPDLMPKPLRDRFTMQEDLLPYEKDKLVEIVRKTARAPIENDAAQLIASASLGTPRKALALLASVDDHRVAFDHDSIDIELVNQTFRQRRIDHRGLGINHQRGLSILQKARRPVGQARLATTMGIDRDVFRSTVEPELLRLGLITVTPQGLVAM